MFDTRTGPKHGMDPRGLISKIVCLGALSVMSDSPHNNALAQTVPAESPHTTGELSLHQRQLLEVAREAYVWGWPLMYVHKIAVALDRVPFPGVSGGLPVAPINKLSMLADTIKPRAAAVPCANQDVMYGFGVFDLKREPVVIQVPDFGERFWLYQLGDQRTDSFANLGCVYNTPPGAYLVASEEWDKPLPAGIRKVFRCSTRFAYVIPRVHFDNSEADRKAAMPAVRQIAAYPLSHFDASTKEYSWDKPPWFPNAARSGRARQVSPDTFFDNFPQLLEEVPPRAGEEAMYERFHELVREAGRDTNFAAALKAAAPQMDRELLQPFFEFKNVGHRLPGNWTTVMNGAEFGNDYRMRAAVARSNPFVNRRKEAVYYYLDLDSAGDTLLGERQYEVTFPRSALPPADGFWSLTVYDDRHVLPSDLGGRISIGSRDPFLRLNQDGSLTIRIHREAAEQGALEGGDLLQSSNILSAPSGKFSLYLRLYAPRQEAQDGRWTPPAARRL